MAHDSPLIVNGFGITQMEFHLLQQGVVIADEEKIHIRPVRSKDVALLKDLGFSKPHIVFRSAAREANTARGNAQGKEALLVLLGKAVSQQWGCLQ